MCIAILLPSGKAIDKDTLITCNIANPDGFGFAYFNEDNKICIKKEVDEKKILKRIDKFIEIREIYIDKPFLVHFRIATHGKISKRCTHPFVVNDETIFCHNGILRYDYGVDRMSLDSDTMMFNKNILQRLEKNCLRKMIEGKNNVLFNLMEGYIGSGNKMILLNKDGNFKIINEKAGVWDNGIWYSNTSYKPKPKVTVIDYSGSWWNSGYYGQYWDEQEKRWKDYTKSNYKSGKY